MSPAARCRRGAPDGERAARIDAVSPSGPIGCGGRATASASGNAIMPPEPATAGNFGVSDGILMLCCMRVCIAAFVLVGMESCGQQPSRTTVMTVCDLSRDFTAYRDRSVVVRGVYFYGLRQKCLQTCATDPWPSFVDLVGSDAGGDGIWAEVAQAERRAEQEAKEGRRIEVWVTVRGKLNTSERRSPIGPCDRVVNGGFGHLGRFPAQIAVEAFNDVQVIPNAASPYDYSHIYRGAY